LLVSGAHAQGTDAPAVYGRLNIATERVGPRSGVPVGTNRLSNYRSVLGFRGAEDLGDGLKAI